MKHLKLIPSVFFAMLVFTACSDDDDPVIINESEVITTMRVTLTESGTTNTITFEALDPDGEDGPLGVVYTPATVSLDANTSYSASVQVLDESDPNDVEDITLEVIEEDLEHQFFYCESNGSGISISNLNTDSLGNDLGNTFNLTTTSAATGTLKITLLHDGDKSANPDACNLDAAGVEGEIDVEFTFDFEVN